MKSSACALALCIPAVALAAPAPSLRLVTAEAVVKPPKGNPRGVAAQLAMTPAFLAAQPHGSALRSMDLANPSTWLASRVQMTADEKHGTITLRVVGCPSKEAVALLTGV